MNALFLAALLLAPPAPDAEARIVEYLKSNVKPGTPVVVSDLYNNVFTAPDERTALDRLFNTFFKIPLFVAQYHRSTGKAPTIAEIGEQFHFRIPGQTDLMLRIMESDPRMPKFITRDAKGEIASVDVDAILAHPRFGKALERTIAGWEGKPAPAFTVTTYEGSTLSSSALAGKPHVVYFWFTNCPPCLKTSPLLVELHKVYGPKGLQIVGVNADRVLELPYSDADRQAYAKKLGISFSLAHMTAEMQEAYGAVSVFPTLFVVDRNGVVVKHFVNYQERASLEAALQQAVQ